jgi:hypothetical protein
MFNFPPENASQFMKQYDTINRASYCTKAMFDVEDFLKSIIKQLNIHPKSRYWDLTMQLKERLHLSDYQQKILNLPAITRNSLHSNGYHTKDYFEVNIGRKKYKFEKGEKVRCTDWANLYIMFDELLDIMEIVIESPEVKELSDIPHTSETYYDIP